MKEKISRAIFWVLSIGIILWGIILTFLTFFINRSMLLQALAIPICGMAINPAILDKIIKKIFKAEVHYFSVIEFSLKFIGVSFALIIAYVVFINTQDEKIDTNLSWLHFESLLKIVVFVIYLGILFVSKNANKVAKYIIFGLIYFVCVIFSFASLQIHYVIMYLLNIISSNDLDFIAYEMLMNDVLIPIKEAILTYIIFDTIMVNKNRKEDKIEAVNETIKDDTTNKCQLNCTWYKKKKYTPYNFDEKKEYRIYKNIENKYRKEIKGEKFKENKESFNFDNYLEWEKYFINKFSMSNNNACNFWHFLNRRLRMYNRCAELYKTVVAPIYIAIVSIIISIFSSKGYSTLLLTNALLVGIVIILIAVLYSVHVNTAKKYFYEDCMKIVENINIGH